jgi:hypothetical protein
MVVTGTVVDGARNPGGDLYNMATEAVDMVGALVAELGKLAA